MQRGGIMTGACAHDLRNAYTPQLKSNNIRPDEVYANKLSQQIKGATFGAPLQNSIKGAVKANTRVRTAPNNRK